MELFIFGVIVVVAIVLMLFRFEDDVEKYNPSSCYETIDIYEQKFELNMTNGRFIKSVVVRSEYDLTLEIDKITGFSRYRIEYIAEPIDIIAKRIKEGAVIGQVNYSCVAYYGTTNKKKLVDRKRIDVYTGKIIDLGIEGENE